MWRFLHILATPLVDELGIEHTKFDMINQQWRFIGQKNTPQATIFTRDCARASMRIMFGQKGRLGLRVEQVRCTPPVICNAPHWASDLKGWRIPCFGLAPGPVQRHERWTLTAVCNRSNLGMVLTSLDGNSIWWWRRWWKWKLSWWWCCFCWSWWCE